MGAPKMYFPTMYGIFEAYASYRPKQGFSQRPAFGRFAEFYG